MGSTYKHLGGKKINEEQVGLGKRKEKKLLPPSRLLMQKLNALS